MSDVACSSCSHAEGWHKRAGCTYPGCPCGIDGAGDVVPRSKRITRCSVCRRRPDKYGGNHARGCARWGHPANMEEGR